MGKLKSKGVWTPLVGVVLLAASWYSGVGIPEEQAAEVAEEISVLAENAEALYVGLVAVLLVVAGWFGWKK